MTKKYIQTAGGSALGKPHLNPPTRCDSCTTLIEEVFYDAATRSGTWGNFCPKCAKMFQIQLGWGQGQQYTLQEIPDEPIPQPFILSVELDPKP